jgi:hypothetical protein
MTLINFAAIVGIVIALFFARTHLPLWIIGMIAMGTLLLVNLAGYRGAKRDQAGISDPNRSKAGFLVMWLLLAAGILLIVISKQ